MAKGWLPSKNVLEACELALESIAILRNIKKKASILEDFNSTEKYNSHHIIKYRSFFPTTYGEKMTMEELEKKYDDSIIFLHTRAWWDQVYYLKNEFKLLTEMIELCKVTDNIFLSHEEFILISECYKED